MTALLKRVGVGYQRRCGGNMIIVGSWAALHWDWKYREPKDLDIWLCEGRIRL